MLKKRAALCETISILLALLAFNFACGGKMAETTSPASDKSPIPPLKPFEFQTVMLDANGKVMMRRNAQAMSYQENLGGGVQLEMVLIPAGRFLMGSPASEKGRLETEGPQHQVTVGTLYVSRFEVTQGQWRAVASLPKIDLELKRDPSFFKGDDLPVEQVSWYEAVEFCKRLSKKTLRAYRLPSEAEWEYAARAGMSGPFAFGETITPETVNYNGSYPYASATKGMNRGKTVAIGALGVANAFGLSDMHGNVEEWCLDNWHDTYDGAPADGSAWTSGGDPEYMVLRGGSLYSSANYCRNSLRSWLGSQFGFRDVGFRVVVAA